MAVSKEWLNRTWSLALDKIHKNFIGNEAFYDQFFDPTKLVSVEDALAIISTNSVIVSKVLSNNANYSNLVVAALKEVTQTEYSVKFIDERSYKSMTAPALTEQETPLFFASSRINPSFTFANFVVGPSNLDAVQAAVLASSNPGAMNPIFIYSSTGYGKTHLLNAIGNAFRERFGSKKVLYTNTDSFIDEFVKFTRGRSDGKDFKQFFDTVDILLIDDIQFLRDKVETSAFFFNIFNTFVNTGRQIVMTSDRSPAELQGLEDRLVSRFSSGLTVMIGKPQPETMLDILKVKIKGLGLDLALFEPEVLDYLVSHNPGNIRSMEGDLNKLIFTSNLTKNTGPITLDTCKLAFGDRQGRGGGEADPLTAKKIVASVCGYYSVTESQVRSKVRTLQIALARQISMYLCRRLLDMPFMEIGKEFQRDHSTVMSAVRKIAESVKTDPALSRNVAELSKKLSAKTVGKS